MISQAGLSDGPAGDYDDTSGAPAEEPATPKNKSLAQGALPSLEEALGEQLELLGRMMKARPSVEQTGEVQRALAVGNAELRSALQTQERRRNFVEEQDYQDVGPDITQRRVCAEARVGSDSGGPATGSEATDRRHSLVTFSNRHDKVHQMNRSDSEQKFVSGAHSCLFRVVDNPRFELIFGTLIVANTVIMVIEEQWQGSMVGNRIKFYSEYGTGNRYYEILFLVLEWAFAIVFSLEVFLRMGGFGARYWRRPSEYFDLAVVVASLTSLMAGRLFPINIQVARLLRLAKIMRLIRLIRTIEGFDSLHLMTTALRYSVWALWWSVMMLITMQTFVALVLNVFFRTFYLNEDSWLSRDDQLRLFEYFGSYTRTMCSLFEIALANWPPICRFLMEHLWEGWMVWVIMYKLIMGVAVVGVINAVFMQETMKVASTDDMIMIRTRARAAALHERKMKELFDLADKDHDGTLTREELEEVLKDDSIKTWLASMDIIVDKPELLYELIGGNNDSVTFKQLVKGVTDLKGTSRAVDMRHLIKKVDNLKMQTSTSPGSDGYVSSA